METFKKMKILFQCIKKYLNHSYLSFKEKLVPPKDMFCCIFIVEMLWLLFWVFLLLIIY